MGIGVFTDKAHQPTAAEIQEAIGPMWSLWQQLVRFIRENYPADEDVKFLYGRRYGWALRFRIRRQLLTSLYPTQGGFTVQINLDPGSIERAQAMGLGESAREAIARAHPYAEGRWLFIPVTSAHDLEDIQQLLALRVESKRLWPKRSS